MIEKMKFLSITGPKEDIDRVLEQYLSKYEIQIENALSELKTVKGLRPYIEINPYKEPLQTSLKLKSQLKGAADTVSTHDLSIDEAIDTVNSIDKELNDLYTKKNDLTTQIKAVQESKNKLIPFTELDYDVSSILHFNFIRFRFGRIAREYYDQLEEKVLVSLDTIFYKCHEDKDYIWAVYFVPEGISKKIDAIYASLHFERVFLPDEYEGTPEIATKRLEEQLTQLNCELNQIQSQIQNILDQHRDDILAANAKLDRYTSNFNVRKLAACTKQEVNTFYILCGWMTESDAAAFQKELEGDTETFCVVEDNHHNILSQPPTKLKNPALFRPFEMFIRMYGVPAYNEMDPTILIALTYSFLFGFMFGDAGQGLCLLIGGLVLFKAKKISLAAIISCCGFFSTIFGLLFGSVFGFEELIPALWLRPANAMMALPFIGKLNTVFIVAVGLGMFIILFTMILNIINSIRCHDTEHTWFDTNGVAGLVFYGAAVATIFLFMSGHTLPGAAVLIVLFLVPLAVIFCKEPLTALVEKEAKIMPDNKGMFFVQGFFELFEVLLSYFSNSLSFVRVGAFAVSHAAMMQVVLMLAGAESGNINWVVVVLGNLFVCGMEGLIVGIQVLRLEYYELFSRFYKGDGREFKPYGKTEA